MTDKRYCTIDDYGREVFDRRAYDDDEQMRILSQMRQEEQMKKSRVTSHGILSFFRRRKTSVSSHTR